MNIYPLFKKLASDATKTAKITFLFFMLWKDSFLFAQEFSDYEIGNKCQDCSSFLEDISEIIFVRHNLEKAAELLANAQATMKNIPSASYSEIEDIFNLHVEILQAAIILDSFYGESELAFPYGPQNIGINATIEEGVLEVIEVIEDSPAAESSLASGDLITAIAVSESSNFNLIGTKSLAEIASLIKGPAGSVVRLEIVDKNNFDESGRKIVEVTRGGSKERQEYQKGFESLISQLKQLVEINSNPSISRAIQNFQDLIWIEEVLIGFLIDSYQKMGNASFYQDEILDILNYGEQISVIFELSSNRNYSQRARFLNIHADLYQKLTSATFELTGGTEQYYLEAYEVDQKRIGFYRSAVEIVSEYQGAESINLIYPLASICSLQSYWLLRYPPTQIEAQNWKASCERALAISDLHMDSDNLDFLGYVSKGYDSIILEALTTNIQWAEHITPQEKLSYLIRYSELLESSGIAENYKHTLHKLYSNLSQAYIEIGEVHKSMESRINRLEILINSRFNNEIGVNLSQIESSDNIKFDWMSIDLDLTYLARVENWTYVIESLEKILTIFYGADDPIYDAAKISHSEYIGNFELALGSAYFAINEIEKADKYFTVGFERIDESASFFTGFRLPSYVNYLSAVGLEGKAKLVEELYNQIYRSSTTKDKYSTGDRIFEFFRLVDIANRNYSNSDLSGAGRNARLALAVLNTSPSEYFSSGGGTLKVHRDIPDAWLLGAEIPYDLKESFTGLPHQYVDAQSIAALHRIVALDNKGDITEFKKSMELAIAYDERFQLFLIDGSLDSNKLESELNKYNHLEFDCFEREVFGDGFVSLALKKYSSKPGSEIKDLEKARDIYESMIADGCWSGGGWLSNYAIVELELDNKEKSIMHGIKAFEDYKIYQTSLKNSAFLPVNYFEISKKYSYIAKRYIYLCSSIEDAKFEDHCDENIVLAYDLATLKSNSYSLLSGFARGSLSDEQEKNLTNELVELTQDYSLIEKQIEDFSFEEQGIDDYYALSSAYLEMSRNIDILSENLATKSIQFEPILSPDLLNSERLIKLIKRDEGVVFLYSFDDSNSLLTLVTEKGVVNKKVPMSSENIKYLVSEVRSSLEMPRSGKISELKPFNADAAYKLFYGIFGALAPELLHVETISFLSDGVLDSLPLSLLVINDPTSLNFKLNESWASNRFKFKRLPSLRSIFTLQNQNNGEVRIQKFLGVGDPSLGDSLSKTRALEIIDKGIDFDLDTMIRTLPSLPGTRKELETLANYFAPIPSSTLLLGDQATEANVKKIDLSEYSTIAFATHGLMSGEIAGLKEPALVLTPEGRQHSNDGLLTASEIVKLNLNAELVILSACNSYLDGNLDNEGLSGLSTAFIFAGTQSLMVTHWEIDSEIASFLTTTTIAKFRNEPDAGLASALNYAMNNAREKEEWNHPALWAPFSIIGDRQGL